MRHLPDSLIRTIRAVSRENNTNRWPDVVQTWEDTDQCFKAIWLDHSYQPGPDDEDENAGIEGVFESSNWREPGNFGQWLLNAPNGFQEWHLMDHDGLDSDPDYEDGAIDEDPMGKYYGYNI